MIGKTVIIMKWMAYMSSLRKRLAMTWTCGVDSPPQTCVGRPLDRGSFPKVTGKLVASVIYCALVVYWIACMGVLYYAL